MRCIIKFLSSILDFSCLSTVCFLLLYRFSYDCFFHPSTSVKFPFESVLTFWGIVFSCGGCLEKCVDVYWIADSTSLFDTLFKHGGMCWINKIWRVCTCTCPLAVLNQSPDWPCEPVFADCRMICTTRRVHKAFGIQVNMLSEHSWPGFVACVSLHLMS